MVQIERAHRQQLFAAIAADLAETVVDPDEATVFSHLRRANGNAVEEATEVGLAGLQGLGRLLFGLEHVVGFGIASPLLALHLVGDIDQESGRTNQRTGIVTQRRHIGEHVAAAAVRSHDDDLAAFVFAAALQRQRRPARFMRETRAIHGKKGERSAISLGCIIECRAPSPQLRGAVVEKRDSSCDIAAVRGKR